MAVSASYIEPCARSDPEFNACALKHAKETFPTFVKGEFYVLWHKVSASEASRHGAVVEVRLHTLFIAAVVNFIPADSHLIKQLSLIYAAGMVNQRTSIPWPLSPQKLDAN
jgi:hypothetical protein